MSWKYSEDNIAAEKNVNVGVAAYVTTQARLKLYEDVSRLGQSVLYCDRICDYVLKVDETSNVTTGDYLDDLTNELEDFGYGSFIYYFVSGGQKKYAFSVICPSTGKCTTKCKSIILNYENLKPVNVTALKNIILEDTPSVHVHNPKIKRKHVGIVVSEPETKEYKVVFKKRRLMEKFNSSYRYH